MTIHPSLELQKIQVLINLIAKHNPALITRLF